MKLLLTGATGAAGSQILLTALSDPSITSITILARRPLPSWLVESFPPTTPTTPTLDTIVVNDFTRYPPEIVDLGAFDACIWAQGSSAFGMTEEDYIQMTYGYPMAAAKAMSTARAADGGTRPARFIYITGELADQSEKSWYLGGRIMGRTEVHLLALPPPVEVTIIRPAYFFPSHPILRPHIRPSILSRAWNVFITPILLAFRPEWYMPVEDLGKFSVAIAKGWDTKGERLFRNTVVKEFVKHM
ncbi:hypothetical protein PLICRDRAFT_51468 [Plicaturopsis crispa FD-325 SS-3]|nr:hypothetical protein PLICRDRAFT_51468 [Plicaturopsis crispa FD-325 SS-3]